MHVELSIDDFLVRARELPVLDVRTPAEFASGHIPWARNFPLFSDEERAEVGTVYARHGREKAVRLGLERVAPKMTDLADSLIEAARGSGGELLIHCWRGGMRGGSVAWLAETLGLRPATLKGGYKAFRRWVMEAFAVRRDIRVVAGLTGTGKTAILRVLADQGASVIDIEAMACHKGSVFGDLGEAPQPRQEQFENDLATAWMACDPQHPVWMEDESRTIGRRVIPAALWEQKCHGRFEVVEIPVQARIENLRAVYEGFPLSQLEPRIEVIRERLGGERAKQVISALRAGDPVTACSLLLTYYDRTYQKWLDSIPEDIITVHHFEYSDPARIARELLQTS